MSDSTATTTTSVAAEPTLPAEFDNIDQVQIDGLVVMKIIKHCKENLPELVTGQLLGLDVGPVLEVTNCFPFPKVDEEEEEGESEPGVEYQIEMMKCLREVNVDNNTVGWYQTTYLGSFLNESMIETQFNYQATIKKCVVVIYDPMRSRQGSLWLKAFRLSQSAMAFYRQNPPNASERAGDAKLPLEEIFDEIPIKIHNSHLINAFLLDLDEKGTYGQNGVFASLDLANSSFFARNLEFMIDSLDELSAEQSKWQNYQRSVQKQQNYLKKKADARKEDGPEEDELPVSNKPTPGQPNKIDALLYSSQINKYCQQINTFAGQSSTKLFLLGALQKQQ